MSEMIERGVAALKGLPVRDNEQRGGELDELRLREAVRAVIQAMREPTAGMLMAATAAEHGHFYPDKNPTAHTWKSLPAMLVKKLWQAMIDAALNEKSPAGPTYTPSGT